MLRRVPPLESLRVLEACVRHSSFTRAAHEIGVTPAAVSLRIRNLESEIGTTLFKRSGPKLVPSAAALALAARVADALGSVYEAVADCRGSEQALRLTAVPSFAVRWLAPRLARYHRQPGSVPIRMDSSAEVRATDDFDVAIRTGGGHWAPFEVTRLMPVDATPMLSPALAAKVRISSPADLAKLPLLRHDDWPRWFGQVGARPRRLRHCRDEYPTHELDGVAATEGEGVALLAPTLFASLVRAGKLIQPFTEVLRGPHWHYVLLKQHEKRIGARTFRDWLQEEVRNADC